jgi:hypothetical protein
VTLDHEHLRSKFGQVAHVAIEENNRERLFFQNKNLNGLAAKS